MKKEKKSKRKELSEEVQAKEKNAPPIDMIGFQVLYHWSVRVEGVENSSIEETDGKDHIDHQMLAALFLCGVR